MCFKSLINVKYYICAKAWSQKEVAVNHFNTNRKKKKKISYFLTGIKVQLILHLQVTLLQMLPLQSLSRRQQQIKTRHQP